MRLTCRVSKVSVLSTTRFASHMNNLNYLVSAFYKETVLLIEFMCERHFLLFNVLSRSLNSLLLGRMHTIDPGILLFFPPKESKNLSEKEPIINEEGPLSLPPPSLSKAINNDTGPNSKFSIAIL